MSNIDDIFNESLVDDDIKKQVEARVEEANQSSIGCGSYGCNNTIAIGRGLHIKNVLDSVRSTKHYISNSQIIAILESVNMMEEALIRSGYTIELLLEKQKGE